MLTEMRCQHFCDCIYDVGNPLNACLDEYQRAKGAAFYWLSAQRSKARPNFF
jgi:hypothetical protein